MGLEDRFFSWESWDEADSFGSIQFNKCVFKEDVGRFKKGDEVDAILVSFEESKMCVYQGEEEACFALTLNVAPIEDK